jgi:DNA mismatch endonuclease (patch repair protein)
MSPLSIRTRAPRASSSAVRRKMQAVPRTDSGPEILLRRMLHGAGLRFRKEFQASSGMPRADIAFVGPRVLVFVDGCFWHGCPKHFEQPKTNGSWWLEKIGATMERDRRQTKLLRRNGWHVIRVWEHELAPQSLGVTVGRILARVKR